VLDSLRAVYLCTEPRASVALEAMNWRCDHVQRHNRKETGAYYTPPSLARILADWAVTSAEQKILEPCVGGGALVQAVLERFEKTGCGSVVGCEIDRSVLAVTAGLFRGAPVDLRQGDFLSMSASELGRFDAIVGNPPFTRNHHLGRDKRGELRRRDEFRHIVTGAPGLWAYFLVHSMQFVLPGGAYRLCDARRDRVRRLCGSTDGGVS
jgi:adenine-specific DNA-methyltransferase